MKREKLIKIVTDWIDANIVRHREVSVYIKVRDKHDDIMKIVNLDIETEVE